MTHLRKDNKSNLTFDFDAIPKGDLEKSSDVNADELRGSFSNANTINQIFSRLSKTNGKASKRYNVVIPQELFDELQNVADRRGVSAVEMLRKFIKLGILASYIEELPDAALIVREGDIDRELLLI